MRTSPCLCSSPTTGNRDTELIPSFDLRGGRFVRLLRGDFDRETAYGEDPLPVAREHARVGARRLHVVDLDASRGSGDNRDLVRRLVESSRLAVQVAGGVRTADDVEAWLGTGAAAVVMGTTAVREPAVLRTCAELRPGRVLAALDVRAGRPAVTGWSEVADTSVEEVLAAWQEAPLGGVVVTSIDRDGTMAGPDLDLLARVISLSRHPVTYSGGIGSLDDLAAVAGSGASAAILGKALFEGRFTLAEALAAC